MRHWAAEQWEEKLDKVMQELDEFLERKYSGRYSLHPARPASGTTANPSQDGLFSITASFTLGLGSEFGKGYVVDIKLRTLEPVAEEIREEIENEALRFLHRKIVKIFPDRQLSVTRDGPIIKIYGDLRLGSA